MGASNSSPARWQDRGDPIRGRDPVDPARAKQRHSIRDHEGNIVKLVWYPSVSGLSNPFNSERKRIPPFSYQVYITEAASELTRDSKFPNKFAAALEQWRRDSFLDESNPQDIAPWAYHLEIYTKPFKNLLACSAHQRRELRYRRRKRSRPAMVESLARWYGSGHRAFRTHHHHFILVIEHNDWMRDGITFVKFDPFVLLTFDHSYEYVWDSEPDLELAWHQSFAKAASSGDQKWLIPRVMRAAHDFAEKDGSYANILDARNRRRGRRRDPGLDEFLDFDLDHGDDDPILDELGLPQPLPDIQMPPDAPPVDPVEPFDKAELFLEGKDVQSLRTSSSIDSGGLPVSSVWNREQSLKRPIFSITLYTASELPVFDPKGLFLCLNKGLLARAAWRLDVVRDVSSLETAFQHHVVPRSKTGMLMNRRKTLRIIVQKISEPARLPVEICRMIEDILVISHELSEYDCGSLRPARDVFMYLDLKRFWTGPLLVYSNFASYNRSSVHDKSDIEQLANGDCLDQQTMKVRSLRFWARVADEIYTLWSLRSPRCVQEEPIPTLHVGLTRPAGYSAVKMLAQTDATRPITICGLQPFPHEGYEWYRAFELVDSATGEIIPWPPEEKIWFYDDYSFYGWNSGLCYEYRDDLTTLQPYAEPVVVSGCYRIQEALSFLQSGNVSDKITLRWKDGLTVRMWRYGTEDNADDEAHNMPPMPVKILGQKELPMNRNRNTGWVEFDHSVHNSF